LTLQILVPAQSYKLKKYANSVIIDKEDQKCQQTVKGVPVSTPKSDKIEITSSTMIEIQTKAMHTFLILWIGSEFG
jgi:hypothetical protein